MKKIKTICLAGMDVASQFKDIRRSFEDLGIEVLSYTDFPSLSACDETDEYTYVGLDQLPSILHVKDHYSPIVKRGIRKIQRNILPFYIKDTLHELIDRVDCFVFMVNSFYMNYSDLELIRSRGKKIVYIFTGSDARWHFGIKQEFEKLGLWDFPHDDSYDYGPKGLEYRLKRIRSAEKYADVIFSKREQAQLQLRPFYHFPMCVYPGDFEVYPVQRKTKPKVIHAPSYSLIKGTKYVIEAFERLKAEGVDFDPVIVQNVPHKEAVKLYRDADIIIDQLFIPGAGRLATEAMAMGKVVMGRMEYDVYNQGFPIDTCPIVDVNSRTIYQRLKELIGDYEQRQQIANKGREYVEQYLDVSILCKKIQSVVNGETVPFNYEPEFFKGEFIPESQEAAGVYNKWNDILKEESWYKNMKLVDRGGLRF